MVFRAVLQFLAACVLMVGCNQAAPDSPTPVPTVASIQILPRDATGVPLSGSTQLSVVEILSNGSQRAAAASWTTDSDILTVDGTGRVSGRRLGTANISATRAGLVATRLLAVVPNCAGRQTGQVQVVACTKLAGSGRPTCDVGSMHPFVWTMTQAGDQLGGTLSLYVIPASGPITATIDQFGAMKATGLLSRQEDQATITIEEWSTQADEACSTLAGTFTVRYQFTNVVGAQSQREQNVLVGVRRQP